MSRFDIACGYYHFAYNWANGLFNEAIAPGDCRVRDAALKYMMQLERLQYRPGLSDRQLRTSSPEAKAVYMGLVRKHLG